MGTRLRNCNWQPGNDNGKAETWECVIVAVLLDIRDELQTLNLVFKCGNFLAIPSQLRRIARNTTKKRGKK